MNTQAKCAPGTKFTADQIERLRSSMANIATVQPERLADFRAAFGTMSDEMVKQLRDDGGVKFWSKLAINECMRRGLK